MTKSNHGFGPVMSPHEVTPDMLPEKDSIWHDTYAGPSRQARVIGVVEANQNPRMWYVYLEEQFGFKRTFHMLAHGFLSRYERVPGNN